MILQAFSKLDDSVILFIINLLNKFTKKKNSSTSEKVIKKPLSSSGKHFLSEANSFASFNGCSEDIKFGTTSLNLLRVQ